MYYLIIIWCIIDVLFEIYLVIIWCIIWCIILLLCGDYLRIIWRVCIMQKQKPTVKIRTEFESIRPKTIN